MAGFVANAQIHGYPVTRRESSSAGLPAGARRRIGAWLLLLLTGLALPGFGQGQLSTSNKRAIEFYNRGVETFAQRRTSETIQFLTKAIEQDTAFTEAYLKLGQVYEFSRQPEQALQTYQRAIRQQPDRPLTGLAYQFVSTYLLRKGQYSQALPYLERFGKLFAPQSSQGKRIERLRQTALFGQQALQNPLPVKPRPLPAAIQAFPSQYFPVLTADEQTLVFTVLKPEGDEDLMVATQQAESWSAPTLLSERINTPRNEGTPSLSADGRTLVFTACNERNGLGSCDLYISRKTGQEWSAPQNLGPVINTRFWESQPALSADGRRLYFVSDRPGGVGRRDIWCSHLGNDGQWQTPYNLKSINTLSDEASPFIHANGQTLFFASDGHIGMGGYDLFMADSTATGWSNPQNLGYPINTADDQAALFVAANGVRAYYSHEEAGDAQRSKLYVFDLPASIREKIRPVSYLKGIIAESGSKKPLSATIELIDLETNRVVTRVTSDAQTGQYTAVLPSGGEYALYVNVPGYLFKSLSFDFKQKREGEGLNLSVPLEPIRSAGRETLNNIFFESGRFGLADKSRVELERLAQFMEQNPDVKVEISGHTDDRGEAAANLELSRKRAQSVVSFLVQAGIRPDRIRSAGYGETRPLLPNTSEENRQQNRRIEWRIL